MDRKFLTLGSWLHRRAENFIAALLGIMFLAFILQILFRYLLQFPTGWTFELSLVTWLWLVLFGAAFVVTEREEIRFDLIYGSMGPKLRRITAVLTGLFLLSAYTYSLPSVLDYVTFMKVEETAYLNIRFDLLYSIYPIFAVAIITRYVWIVISALRGKSPEAFDPTKASSGV
jgi:TRAP-type C4-dicarboxylate transport system permease small subunit